MTTADTPREELLTEIEDLRIRLEEAEETLRAIGSGEVDAFVVSGPEGPQVFTLKGAEQPYRVLVETMNEGAATLAPDGTILYCNNRLAAMLQVPLESLIGAQLSSYVAPADHLLFLARLGMCAEECDKDEIAMITEAGNRVPVLISCCAADLADNRQISMVITDLTQQKRNEEIVKSERLAHSIIEQAGEAIIVCDERGHVIRASLLAHQLCGKNPLLKHFDESCPLSIAETGELLSVSQALAGETFRNMEVTPKREGGMRNHLILTATPLKGLRGEILGCVLTLTDITERKRMEESLKESEASLKSANEQLQEINQALHEQSGQLLAANEELQTLNEKLQSQSEDLQAQSEELQTQSEELQAQKEELQVQNQELERLWAESKRAEELIRKSEEKLKKLNEELEQRVAQRTAELREKDQILLLQSRQAAMGEMIGNIAHQWRQPLNALGLIVQQTVLFYELGELNKEVLNKNASQSRELIKHMSQTIDDFRNYFRPDKEKVEFKVCESIANTVSLVEDSFKNQNINIEVVAKDDPLIYGYPNELSQAFLNIINNARDALIERKIDKPLVTITIGREDGRAFVSVVDNAGGIPEEIMDRIFDPYFTTKGPHAGTGVGLFMSKTIIEKNMGGRLTARNMGDGAEFRIEV
jgi:PAS domain S-box-containing protein